MSPSFDLVLRKQFAVRSVFSLVDLVCKASRDNRLLPPEEFREKIAV
jgi:hypothetical protein